MLIPPLVTPLLNLTSLYQPNSTSDDLSQPRVYCYTQRPASQPQRLQIVSIDCFTLARKMVRSMGNPITPITFSRDPTKGVKVPKAFTEKTCVIEVDLPPDIPGWQASLRDIAFGSNEIAAPCAHDGDRLGGLTQIGQPAPIMNLYVYGEKWENPVEVESGGTNVTATS